jgi:hypothetical protein
MKQNNDTANARLTQALDHARRNRKFETSLYWHRSVFFWGIILGLIVILELDLIPEAQHIVMNSITYGLTLLGLSATCVWFFIERSSKSRWENWQQHINNLEGRIANAADARKSRILFFVYAAVKLVIVALGVYWLVMSLKEASIFSSSVIGAVPCTNVCELDLSGLQKKTTNFFLSLFVDNVESSVDVGRAVRDQFCNFCYRIEAIRQVARGIPVGIAGITIALGFWLWRTTFQNFIIWKMLCRLKITAGILVRRMRGAK